MEDLNSAKPEKHPESSTGMAASSDGDQFSTFLFWREPLPSIDEDLLEILVSLGHDSTPEGVAELDLSEPVTRLRR